MPPSPLSQKEILQKSWGKKAKSSRKLKDKANSFFLPKRVNSVIGNSLEQSSDDKSGRHMIFQKHKLRGGTRVLHKGIDSPISNRNRH
jgi:hypothetical protein